MVTGKHMDEWSVDCLVLSPKNQDRTVSAKSVTMRDTTFKWLQRIALTTLHIEILSRLCIQFILCMDCQFVK